MKNQRNGFILGIFFICLSMIYIGNAQAGPKWELGNDSWLQLSFLGQVHYSHMEDAAVDNDIYLRRGRIILAGQIMDGIKFFAETDNDNAGKYGTDESTDIQDAFVDFRLGKSEHWLKVGLILLPFSFENRSSAASLLGIDYNSEHIKLVNSFVWRDYGAELNGSFGKKFAYRIGVFDGYDKKGNDKNDDASLRFTGHVAFDLIGEVESGWFFSQDRLGQKGNYLSIGAGIDTQDEATMNTTTLVVQDNDAWVVDFQSGFNIGEYPLTINGAYYDWDNASYEGNTSFIEAGLLFGKVMPTVKVSYLDPENGDETTDTTIGLHYFWKGHNVRAGIEYRTGDSDEWVLAGVQFFL